MSVFHRFRYLMQAKSLPQEAAESLAEFFDAVNIKNSCIDINAFQINGKDVHSAADIITAVGHPFSANFDFEGELNFGTRLYISKQFGVLEEHEAITVIVYEENDDFTCIRAYGDFVETDVKLSELSEEQKFYGLHPGMDFCIPTNRIQLQIEEGFEFKDVFDEALAQELDDLGFHEYDILTGEMEDLGEVYVFDIRLDSALTKPLLDTVNRMYQKVSDAVKKLGGVMQKPVNSGGEPVFTFANAEDMIEVTLTPDEDGLLNAEAKQYTFSEKISFTE